jgi:hypothetical protein
MKAADVGAGTPGRPNHQSPLKAKGASMTANHSTNGKKIPAVGYVRMSSDGQEASPDQQRAEIIKLAELHHCDILRWYQDLGISGDATHKRKDFQRMIADCDKLGD